MIIAIDFDGTCVTHEFPKVGKDIKAVPVLKALVENGHQLVLFTMRSDIVNPTGEGNELHLESGNYLTDAVNWFKENEIPLYGVQTNPTQHTWTTSPKAYAQMYIDDAALGLLKCWKLGRTEIERRGLKGREWLLSDEAKMSAKAMGQNFIENINVLFENWKPVRRFDIEKVEKGHTTYNPSPVQYTPEFNTRVNEILS